MYISANAGDPSKSDSKKNSYSYGWSFYFGALSFIIAEMVGVLAVHMFIDRHKQLRASTHTTDYLQSSAITRIPSYRYRYQRRSRSSSRSTEPSHSRDASPVGIKGFNTLPSTEISMYTLPRDPLKAATTPTATYNSDRDNSFLQVHNCIQKENKDSIHTNTANRRTTPVWSHQEGLKIGGREGWEWELGGRMGGSSGGGQGGGEEKATMGKPSKSKKTNKLKWNVQKETTKSLKNGKRKKRKNF